MKFRITSIILLGGLMLAGHSLAEGTVSKPANQSAAAPAGREVVTLGGGCFWCIEAVFDELKGVERVESGYAGGTVADPTYQQVCSGGTGHAEVVQVTFDPKIIPLKDLLEVFFALHDPTTLNRQGADHGMQYRSVIFYRSPEQKAVAEEAIKATEKAKIWRGTIVTQLTPFTTFYKAENYHQEYYKLHGSAPYCQAVIDPKIAKLREHFKAKLKSQ